MSRVALTFLTLVALSAVAAVLGVALDFGGLGYLVALVVVLVLASLTDRDRFYARDLGQH